MTVKTVPRDQTAGTLTQPLISTLAGNSPALHTLPASRPAETGVRIYRDGLLIGKYLATGLAPSRLFVAIEPLHYPVNSRLEVEFIRTEQATGPARLPATVASRSLEGIELRLDAGPGQPGVTHG